MNYENIIQKRNEFDKRKNESRKQIYEFEFFDNLKNLLDTINSFDLGVRKFDFSGDVKHLIFRLNDFSKALKNNLKLLEE